MIKRMRQIESSLSDLRMSVAKASEAKLMIKRTVSAKPIENQNERSELWL